MWSVGVKVHSIHISWRGWFQTDALFPFKLSSTLGDSEWNQSRVATGCTRLIFNSRTRWKFTLHNYAAVSWHHSTNDWFSEKKLLLLTFFLLVLMNWTSQQVCPRNESYHLLILGHSCCWDGAIKCNSLMSVSSFFIEIRRHNVSAKANHKEQAWIRKNVFQSLPGNW